MTQKASPDYAPETLSFSYRWVMLALVWLPYFVFGVFTRSLSPLVTPILRDLKISFFQMGFILGSWQLTYIGFAAVDGAIIDRWGLRNSLLAGIIILGLSETLRYFASGFVTLLLSVSLIGIGGPLISIGCPKAISLWFDSKERGLATGIYMTAPAVAGLLTFATANSIVMPLTGYSWRLAFVGYGSISLIVAIFWWFFAKDRGDTRSYSSSSLFRVFGALVRQRFVQVVLIMGLLSFAVSHGFSSWLPQILESRGAQPATAGLMASLPLIAGIPFVLLIPRITAPRLRSHVIIFLSLGTALSLLLVATGSGARLLTGLTLYGLSSSSIMPLTILILMESPEIGAKYIGSAAGMYFTVAEVGGFSGPFVLGAVRSASGSFLSGTLVVSALALLMAAIGLYLKRYTVPRL